MNTNELIAYHKGLFSYSKLAIDYETIEALKKLEQIEQIFNEWTECGDNADSWAYRKIREVLENDAELTANTIAELQEKMAKQEQVNQELGAENEDLKKNLERIKQIIDSRDGFYLYDNLPPFQQIKEVFEQE